MTDCIVDLEGLCRMCASSCDCNSSLLRILPGSPLASSLFKFLAIQLEEDDNVLPKQICQNCYDVLKLWEVTTKCVKRAQVFYVSQLKLRKLESSLEQTGSKIAAMFPLVKEPVLKCPICHEYFENMKCLKEHQLIHHGQLDKSTVWPEGTNLLPHNNVPPESQDWRPRFNFSVSLAEILYNWGFLRRKSSQSDSLADTAKARPASEHIELSNFDKAGGGALAASQSQLQPATCNLLSSPLQLSTCSLFCDSEPLRAIASASTGLDSASLKSLVWQELHSTESGVGHDFCASDVCYPTWCDRCGDLLWGLQGEYLRCQNFQLMYKNDSQVGMYLGLAQCISKHISESDNVYYCEAILLVRHFIITKERVAIEMTVTITHSCETGDALCVLAAKHVAVAS